MLSKETIIDKIEIVYSGDVQVRKAVIVSEDGEELSRKFERKVLSPCYKDENNNWQNTDISEEDTEVQAICNAKWTEAFKTQYKATADSLEE